MAKGGGYARGRQKPFRVIRAFDGGKPMRTPHWTLGDAKADLNEGLRVANARGLSLEASIVDVFADETVYTPKWCIVCGTAWATEYGSTRGEDDWSTCAGCVGEDEPIETEKESTTMAEAGKFVGAARPVEYGYMIMIWRDPHSEGHVPVNMARLEVKDWDPDAASELLLTKYGYVTAPGSHWQPLSGDGFGIRLRRAGQHGELPGFPSREMWQRRADHGDEDARQLAEEALAEIDSNEV